MSEKGTKIASKPKPAGSLRVFRTEQTCFGDAPGVGWDDRYYPLWAKRKILAGGNQTGVLIALVLDPTTGRSPTSFGGGLNAWNLRTKQEKEGMNAVRHTATSSLGGVGCRKNRDKIGSFIDAAMPGMEHKKETEQKVVRKSVRFSLGTSGAQEGPSFRGVTR